MQNTNRAQQKFEGGFFLPNDRLGTLACMLFALCVCFTLLVFSPSSAFADSDPESGEYTIESVSITSDIQTDGSLHVVESRVIRFEEPRASLCWWIDLPGGDSVQQLTDISVAQLDVADQQEVSLSPLEYAEYDPAWRKGKVPDGNVYSFDAEHGRTYAFFDVTGEYVLLQVEYNIQGAVQLYKDCAELRWKFVAAGQWSSSSSDVSCSVSFPVPADTQPVVGEDVFGWSHGPEGGGLSFDSGVNSVSVWEELVPADEYAEVRILLPSEWISNATPEVETKHAGSLRRDSVLEEELEWVDQDAHRRLSVLSSFIVFAILSIALTAFALVLYAAFGRVRKVDSPQGEASLAALSEVSIPVLSRLWRWNRNSPEDFSACVMGLVAKGAIRVDSQEAPDGQGARLYFLTETGDCAREELDSLEEGVMRVIFDIVGGGAKSVWVDDLATAGCSAPVPLSFDLDSWNSALSERVDELGYFERGGLFWQRMIVIISCAYLLVALAVSLGVGSAWPVAMALAGCVASVVVANNLGRRSLEASQLYAACQSLRDALSRDRKEDDGVDGMDEPEGSQASFLDDLTEEQWKRLLACSYAYDAYELAYAAAERRFGGAVGSDAAWLAPYKRSGEGLAPCEQIAAAIAEVYGEASWASQYKDAKAQRPAFKERLKALIPKKR